jgi:PKD repeat protein
LLHTYSETGSFTVTLTVTDEGGASDSESTTVLIEEEISSETGTGDNLPPVADSGGPYYGIEDIPVEFDGSGSSDPEGSDLTYLWDFGDGTTGSGVSLLHNYKETGSYTVTLTVIDEGGASDSETTTALVERRSQ